MKRRQVLEHRIARLRQLGVRTSRYMGRARTEFQLLMAATVANLILVTGVTRAAGPLFAALRRALAALIVLRAPKISVCASRRRIPILPGGYLGQAQTHINLSVGPHPGVASGPTNRILMELSKTTFKDM